MSIGDIHSSEPGSGARYNTDKDPLELVPLRYWVQQWRHTPYLPILDALMRWQEGGTFDIPAEVGYLEYQKSALVFEYGAKKYATWNWAKGMKWGVPLGCALRHIRDIVEMGEEFDPESGLPHMGHIVCNLIMIEWYQKYYPEGDDRPL